MLDWLSDTYSYILILLKLKKEVYMTDEELVEYFRSKEVNNRISESIKKTEEYLKTLSQEERNLIP